ncbi:hypothetical protein FAF44_02995 [Nonomuraea sp. MG754425]|uniref:hypothetical protein n=1 Tax=Nonomuraea sp. MG754425 TaxID=2570319 RepID=UPI001F461F6E|nr:hypothetical protein [Nonomuraea sp. MG754425]MCF6467382.1 hypothetical protein [Nonomuraea sp. MG754425]
MTAQERIFLNEDLLLTLDQLGNLERAAHDVGKSTAEVLAMLAGRVQVDPGGRLALSGECDEDDEDERAETPCVP